VGGWVVKHLCADYSPEQIDKRLDQLSRNSAFIQGLEGNLGRHLTVMLPGQRYDLLKALIQAHCPQMLKPRSKEGV
jgi:hypothetical protein